MSARDGPCVITLRPQACVCVCVLTRGVPPSFFRATQMDKKYNENWIVVIGQGFAFEVTHEVKHVLWM